MKREAIEGEGFFQELVFWLSEEVFLFFGVFPSVPQIMSFTAADSLSRISPFTPDSAWLNNVYHFST